MTFHSTRLSGTVSPRLLKTCNILYQSHEEERRKHTTNTVGFCSMKVSHGTHPNNEDVGCSGIRYQMLPMGQRGETPPSLRCDTDTIAGFIKSSLKNDENKVWLKRSQYTWGRHSEEIGDLSPFLL